MNKTQSGAPPPRRSGKKERVVTMTDYRTSAAYLYDGGWRAKDKDEMIIAYSLTEEEANEICKILAEYESFMEE